MGQSRSVAVAAAYAVATLGVSASEAVAMITARRPEANPNPGFLRQLETWARRRAAEDRGAEMDVDADMEAEPLRVALATTDGRVALSLTIRSDGRCGPMT